MVRNVQKWTKTQRGRGLQAVLMDCRGITRTYLLVIDHQKHFCLPLSTQRALRRREREENYSQTVHYALHALLDYFFIEIYK